MPDVELSVSSFPHLGLSEMYCPQGVRRMGLRRSRYDGLPKTHFQHVLTAVAINLVRIDAWLLGKSPGSTYQSPLALLVAHPLLQQSPPPLQEAC